MKEEHIFHSEILLLENNLVENVWGGDWIARAKGIRAPSAPIGEAWEFSTHEHHPGRAEHPSGRTIPLRELVGDSPILTKFIDAQASLSVQVHPPEDYAREHENSPGKSESWILLERGTLYLGFNPTARQRYASLSAFSAAFQHALERNDEKEILAFLNRVEANANEIYHVPPGTIHSIAAGTRLYEVQQSSGITYRIWDWNRRDRALHLKKAMDVLCWDAAVPTPITDGVCHDPLGHYSSRLWVGRVDGDRFSVSPNGPFAIATAVDGDVDFPSNAFVLPHGRSAYVPGTVKSLEMIVRQRGDRVIVSWPGR